MVRFPKTPINLTLSKLLRTCKSDIIKYKSATCPRFCGWVESDGWTRECTTTRLNRYMQYYNTPLHNHGPAQKGHLLKFVYKGIGGDPSELLTDEPENYTATGEERDEGHVGQDRWNEPLLLCPWCQEF